MYSVAEMERIKKEIRTTALRHAALIADEMAEDLMGRHAEEPLPPASAEQVANGYKMIAKLIRRLVLEAD